MISPKFLYKFLFVMMASLVVFGCDSTDDEDEGGMETPAAELFVGNWVLASAADMDGSRDQSMIFEDQGVLSIDFAEEGTFALLFDFADEAEDDLGVSGPYTVSESNTSIALSVSLNGLAVELPFTYRFVNDDTVELTTSDASVAATIGLLLGAALEGNAVLVMERAEDS